VTYYTARSAEKKKRVIQTLRDRNSFRTVGSKAFSKDRGGQTIGKKGRYEEGLPQASNANIQTCRES
jgi:hypothetical protein